MTEEPAENLDRSSPGPAAGGNARARAALTALERYRARRSFDGGGVECLVDRATRVEGERLRRRRIELVERMVDEAGLDARRAEQIYDLARDEGLDPAFAFELVRCGVAVREDTTADPEAPAVMPGQPEWLTRPPASGAARRERMLRTSFRRMRSLLETHDSPEDALIAFARAPDVGDVDLRHD